MIISDRREFNRGFLYFPSFENIAGIQPQEPGFGKLVIRPYLPESMNSFTCRYNSVRGTIVVSVSRKDENLVLEYSVPKEMDCEVVTDMLEKSAREKGLKNVISRRNN